MLEALHENDKSEKETIILTQLIQHYKTCNFPAHKSQCDITQFSSPIYYYQPVATILLITSSDEGDKQTHVGDTAGTYSLYFLYQLVSNLPNDPLATRS